ncbi:MAG: hypothetical protein VCA13_08080 [PS1 clade bacterium]|jgi:hypothetical protein
MFTERSLQIQLLSLSIVIVVLTVLAFLYIAIEEPTSLRESRYGVPFFTPLTINPETGETISIDELVIHYKGGF